MKQPRVGDLDRRITIQAKTVERDDYGATKETWSDAATVWAQYLPGGGDERFAAAQVYAETQARFRIRWRDDVTTQHRVLFDGKLWDILAIDEMGRRGGLEIKARARA